MTRTLGLAVLAGSCLSPAPAEAPVLDVPRSLVSTVFASADMSPECMRATHHAVERMGALGAKLALVYVEEDHRAFGMAPHTGEVTIHAGLPSETHALAETATIATPGGVALRADIIVGECAEDVIAHELAHVVGLGGVVDHELLMQHWQDR